MPFSAGRGQAPRRPSPPAAFGAPPSRHPRAPISALESLETITPFRPRSGPAPPPRSPFPPLRVFAPGPPGSPAVSAGPGWPRPVSPPLPIGSGRRSSPTAPARAPPRVVQGNPGARSAPLSWEAGDYPLGQEPPGPLPGPSAWPGPDPWRTRPCERCGPPPWLRARPGFSWVAHVIFLCPGVLPGKPGLPGTCPAPGPYRPPCPAPPGALPTSGPTADVLGPDSAETRSPAPPPPPPGFTPKAGYPKRGRLSWGRRGRHQF